MSKNYNWIIPVIAIVSIYISICFCCDRICDCAEKNTFESAEIEAAKIKTCGYWRGRAEVYRELMGREK